MAECTNAQADMTKAENNVSEVMTDLQHESDKKKTTDTESETIADLTEIIAAWAGKEYASIHKVTKEKFDKLHEENKITIDIDMENVNVCTVKSYHTEKKVKEVNNKEPRIIFRSNFINNTSATQNHTFKTERDTTSTFTTTVTHGYSSKFNLGISLNLPASLGSVSTGFSDDVTLQRADTTTHGKTVRWFVDTVISVPMFTRTTAEVHVEENVYESTFSIFVKISGNFVVQVHQSGCKMPPINGDIANVLRLHKQSDAKFNEKFKDTLWYNEALKAAVWEVKGTSKILYGVEQNVVLCETKLSEKERNVNQSPTT